MYMLFYNLLEIQLCNYCLKVAQVLKSGQVRPKLGLLNGLNLRPRPEFC